MLIAHLTDFHMLEQGQLLGKVLDVNSLVWQAVETVNASPVPPAFVVMTGDLTHTGTRDEMVEARRALDALTVPYFAITGGHDVPDVFHDVFGERGWRDEATGDTRYVVDDYPVRLVMADTTAGKGHLPEFGPERCEWLDRTLSEAPDKPTLLGLHYPPFQCRVPVRAYVEDVEVAWAEGLKAVVSRHPQIQSVVCGHVHRTTHVRWAGTMASIGPSPTVQSEPLFSDLKAMTGRRMTLALEPGGWQALWWDGEALLNIGMLADRSYARY